MFVSYGIDNVNKDIGVTLTPGKSKDIKQMKFYLD